MSAERDVRRPGDDARKARFHIGWADADRGRTYGDDTLSRLTWQNLGWRHGSLFGPTDPDQVDDLFAWCDRQRRAGLDVEDEPER